MVKPMKCLLLAVLSLSSRSLGAPTSPAGGTTMKASFDDLVVSAAANPVPVPYQSLRFGSFAFAASKVAIDSLQAHSRPNYAISGYTRQLQTGEPATIDVKYAGSTVTSFDLQSLYFGCTITTQVSATVVTACTVQVTGTKAATGATVGPELINFAPPSVAGTGVSQSPDLAFASFSDMTGLSSVTFQVDLSSLPAAQAQTTALYLDDVVHTNYE
ncbi:MAG: hypothetical protein M1826_004960 [Phylliscum demangeonii]|nr:MAG: hypothetical protein M1826_004960 [Phylliscum demangeonii]